ncbi:MAG: ATP-binding protein [Burkholderiaceae bacterium]
MRFAKVFGPIGVLAEGRWRFGARQALVALIATVIARGGRDALMPWLGTDLPFITAFPVIAIVAFFSGITTAAVTAVACAVWLFASWWPLHPIYTFSWNAVVVFIPSAFLVAFFSGQGRDEAATAVDAAIDSASTRLTVNVLRLSMLIAFALPTLLFIVAGGIFYVQAFDEARLRVDREVRIAQEHASKIFENNESIIHAVLDYLALIALDQVDERERALNLKLMQLASDLKQVQSVWVISRTGEAVASNRFFPVPKIQAADRDYFRWHQAHQSGTYISEPLVSRSTGETFFDVSRRWDDHGRFAGVVSVSLYPAYFSEFYRETALDESGLLVMMLRDDATMIASWPLVTDGRTRLSTPSALAAAMAAGDAQGGVEGTSSIDGKDRITAFRRVDRYPLYVIAGIDRAAVVAGWQRRVAMLAAFMLPISMALMYVVWIALRRTRRELAAQQSLQREVEQRARVENALHHIQKLEALGRLTGGVAHDFNNLLTIVSNNLHLLWRLDTRLVENKQLAAIARAVASGERLTRQLLAFARRQPLQPEVLSIQERLPALLGLIAPTLGPRITSEVEIHPHTKPVLVDPAELELAVINLAVNAKDAMPDGGKLTLSARNAAAGEIDIAGDFVVVTVADTGTGIDPALTERVFEPFFTTKPPGEGTGLGLSQVYGLCAQAGGTVRIDTAAGLGTQVNLYLPATAPVPLVSSSPSKATDQRLSCNILLVEDNEEVAIATEPLLRTIGCTVRRAASGDAARGIIDADPDQFDIVVSDMAMPGELDGLGLAEYLRTRHSHIHVILTTGYTSQLQEAFARRFTVLAKPCAPDVLVNAMREAMRKAAAPKATIEG